MDRMDRERSEIVTRLDVIIELLRRGRRVGPGPQEVKGLEGEDGIQDEQPARQDD